MKLRTLVVCISVICTGLGCSKKDELVNNAETDLDALVSKNFAIASPVAQSSDSFASSFDPSMLTDADETVDSATSEITEALDADSAAAAYTGVNLTANETSVDCYGPVIVYVNHPGGTGSAGSGCPSGGSPYCLPSGDTGIWAAKEGATEACSAAKMNALINAPAQRVNNALLLMAAIVRTAELAGQALPAAGETVDLTSAVSAAFAGATVTTATLGRAAADYSGTSNPVYELSFAGTVASSEVSLTLRHSPDATVAGDSKGIVYGYVSEASQYKGFSVVYNVTSGAISYLYKGARTATTTGLFDTNGVYAFPSGFSDARYILSALNGSGLGDLKFAWQAGSMDSKARVFHAHTETVSATDQGYAYFGFGPNFSGSVGDISGMCCNWAGPGASCMGGGYDTTNVQNQTFTRHSTGVFTPATSAITYAPTNSCNHSPATTFKYGTVAEWGADGSGISVANVTNNLGTQTAVGTMPTITAPAFSP